MPKRATYDERFAEKYVVDAATGCWFWTGAALPTGYSRFRYEGRMVSGHRWAYERFVGPIPEGLTLDHLCRTPRCVNPAHLEPVTAVENIRRAAAARATCPQGHEYDRKNNRGERICMTCIRAHQRRYKPPRVRGHVIPGHRLLYIDSQWRCRCGEAFDARTWREGNVRQREHRQRLARELDWV